MTEGSAGVRPRRSVAPRIVFVGLIASFAMAAAVAMWIHARYMAYERVAARHVHQSAAALVRIDLEKVATYDPFRRHLLPLIRQGPRGGGLKPRLERLRHHTRLELGVDIRELVYAVGADANHWSLALGGVFPHSGVPRGVHEVLEEESTSSELAVNQLTFETGAGMTQAADGVVVVASDARMLSSAAAPSARHRELGLPETGPVALALDGNALASETRRALGRKLGIDLTGLRLTAQLGPENPQRCQVEVVRAGAGANPSDLVTVVQRLTGLGKAEIEVSVLSQGRIRLAFPISSEHLDEAAGALAHWLAARLSLPQE